MSVTVSDFLANLRSVDIKSLTDTIISENQNKIIDLNREDQIFNKGIDATGQKLSTYAPATQSIFDTKEPNDTKGRHKPRGVSYNLFWTGESYRNFRAYRKGFNLFITSNSRGRKLLIENGGENIFGLTKINKDILNWSIIAVKLNDKVRKILF